MQSNYPFAFEREMGCTGAELRSWLPGACGGRSLEWCEDGVMVPLGDGHCTIEWRALTPRRIALMTVPRLAVRFDAQDVEADAWEDFMRYFDLYTLRGGG